MDPDPKFNYGSGCEYVNNFGSDRIWNRVEDPKTFFGFGSGLNLNFGSGLNLKFGSGLNLNLGSGFGSGLFMKNI